MDDRRCPLPVPWEDWMKIDWKNPSCLVTEHFTVKELIWLRKWNRLANEADGLNTGIKLALVETAHLAEDVRAVLGVPLMITSFFRPTSYSYLVGSNPSSPHCHGRAFDFTTIPNMSIEDAKAKLRPALRAIDARMEKGTTTWIHIDSFPVGPSGREFVPL